MSISVPDFLYGTAWKEDRTAALTELALRVGFRGIDTANQRRHYFEAAVPSNVGERDAHILIPAPDRQYNFTNQRRARLERVEPMIFREYTELELANPIVSVACLKYDNGPLLLVPVEWPKFRDSNPAPIDLRL